MIASSQPTRYIDPKTLARIASLKLRARMLIEGYHAGRHRSPHQGSSTEFAAHRPYVHGDDVRHVDWKIYARTDRLMIKRYQQETNLNLVLVVDQSTSMAYRSNEAALSKHDYAATLAASLAHLALSQRDSVSMATFEDQIVRWIPPSNRRSHLEVLLGLLTEPAPMRATGLGHSIEQLARRVDRRCLFVIVSDFFDESEAVLGALSRLRNRGCDAIVFVVLDPAEIAFPFTQAMVLEDPEKGDRVHVEGTSIRRAYQQQLGQFLSTLRGGCQSLHYDFALLNTIDPLDEALSIFMASRTARIRRRSARVMGGG